VSSKQPLVLEDSSTAVLTDAERSVCEQRQLRTILYVPLTYQGEVIGVLIPASTGIAYDLTEVEINICQTLAGHAALSLSEAMAGKSGLRANRPRGLLLFYPVTDGKPFSASTMGMQNMALPMALLVSMSTQKTTL
jgi:GAF domain-containing protein